MEAILEETAPSPIVVTIDGGPSHPADGDQVDAEGMFVLTRSPEVIGTEVRGSIRIEELERDVRFRGRVVYSSPRTASRRSALVQGMGIKFVDLDPADQVILEAHAAGRPRPPAGYMKFAVALPRHGSTRPEAASHGA